MEGEKVLTVEQNAAADLPRRLRDKPEDRESRRRLSAARFPYKSKGFALAEVEADIVNRSDNLAARVEARTEACDF